MRSRVLAAAVLAVTLTAALVGCSDLEDKAKESVQDAAGDAACSLAGSAVEGAGDQADRAVDRIGADPAAAEGELRKIRDVLSSAKDSVSGDLEATIGDAQQAVERLLGQAEAAAEGTPVDKQKVEKAEKDLRSAIDDVKDVC